MQTPLRQRDILLFWLPLLASWALMTAEGSILSAVINRLPDEVRMLAAFGIALGLEITLESPIIQLLATSTALARDRRSYRLLRRFTLHSMVVLTVAAALLAVPAVFDLVVRRAMATPDGVADLVWLGIVIMIPWSAAIAWRRFLQGVLIAAGRTRPVAWGTAVRLVFSAGGGLAFGLSGQLPGIAVGAAALVAGVIAEAVFATWAVRPALAEMPESTGGAPLTYPKLLRFHLPLALTSMLTLLMQPLIAASLTRLPKPVVSLSAWPLVFHFSLLMRAMALALPEAVIALSQRPGSFLPLRRFSRRLTLVSLGLMGLFTLTPLAELYLLDVQSAAGEVLAHARLGFLLFLPFPALATWLSWLRGRLIYAGAPRRVNEAVFVRLAVTVVLLGGGVALQTPGIVVAALAVVVSTVVEVGYLAVFERRERPPEMPAAPSTSPPRP